MAKLARQFSLNGRTNVEIPYILSVPNIIRVLFAQRYPAEFKIKPPLLNLLSLQLDMQKDQFIRFQ